MEYNIRAYVDELFRDVPDTQRAYEMKMELTQNLLDKYNDLIASGKTEEEAYNITIFGIGDISELLEELRREEPVYQSHGESVNYYKAMYYFRRRSAALIAISVMLYIFSVIPVVVLGVLGDMLKNDLLGVAGVAGMFAFVGVATALMIWNSSTTPKRKDPPEMVMDLYSRRQKKGGLALQAFDASFWTVMLAVYFLLSFTTGRWDLTWILFIIAPAVSGMIHTIANKKGEEK